MYQTETEAVFLWEMIMARNRMIKPEFWSSDSLMSVSRDSRLTFIGIWNFCDDYGFCLNSNRSLLGDIYPYDETVTEVKLRSWINELVSQKLLIPVEYQSKHLLFVKGWGEHQTVQHKSKRCHIDIHDLEQVIKDSLKSHESLIDVYLESHAPKRKKKEKEESNKEKGFNPPELFQVKAYFCEKGYTEQSAIKAFNYYSVSDWKDSRGQQVKNWKQKMQGVWFKAENETSQPIPVKDTFKNGF